MNKQVLEAQIGDKIGVSDWMQIDQSATDAFADLTHDHAPIHVDPKAAAKTPLGGTIVHGFHTLSLLSVMSYQVLEAFEGEKLALNYGFERIRFVSPVPNGARLRGHFTLVSVVEPKPGALTIAYDVSVEIEGQTRPAMVARWLHRREF